MRFISGMVVVSVMFVSSLAMSAPSFSSEQIQALTMMPIQVKEEKGPLKWKIGEGLNYVMSVKGIPLGTLSTKFVAKTQTEYILAQTFSIFGKQVEIQVKYDKATGEPTSYNIGGAPIPVEASETKIIDRDEEYITVPAGAYNCTRYNLEVRTGLPTQAWMNKKELPLSGTVKVSTMIKDIEVSFELVSFTDAN